MCIFQSIDKPYINITMQSCKQLIQQSIIRFYFYIRLKYMYKAA